MYSILYNLFFALKRLDRKKHSERVSRLCSKYYDLFDMYLNVVFIKRITIFKSNRSGVTKKKRKQKIVVSLTSFPARIEKVWITIETILRQSVKADEIILWLAESQFNGFDSLPEDLKKLCDRGLKIKFCDDLRSHKKYYYAFQEFRDDLVILADDDAFYPRDTIKQLMKMHEKYPEDAIGTIAQGVPEDITVPPSEWPKLREQAISSKHAQPFTGQGTLYCPNKFKDVLYNKTLISELAPLADDLWIYIVGYLSGIRVTVIPKLRSFPVVIWGTGDSSLFNINGNHGDNMNDVQWSKLVDYFKIEDHNL